MRKRFVMSVICLALATMVAVGCENTSGVNEKNKKVETEEKKLSEMDLKVIVGRSEKEVKKLGFEKNESDGKYYAGDICIGLDDNERVNYILIKGSADQAPAFHKVKLGMNMDTAMNVLQNNYDKEERTDDEYIVISYEEKEKIVLEEQDDKVVSICYSTLSDEDITNMKAIEEEKQNAAKDEEDAAQEPEVSEPEVSEPEAPSDNFNTSACSNLMASWAEGVIPAEGSYVYITGMVTGHTGGTIFLQPHQVVPDMCVYYDSTKYTPIEGTEITVYGVLLGEVIDGQYGMDGYVFTN